MNKTTHKKKGYFTTMIIPMIVGIVMLVWYVSTDSIFEKLLVFFIFFVSVIPATLQLISVLLSDAVKKGIKPNRNIGDGKEYNINPTKRPINNTINQKDSGIKKSYNAKTINNENYNELRNRIKELVKSSQLDRQSILQFKSELNYRLGTHQYNYVSFQFENDMHEIYVKLKSSKLTDEDYTYLKAMLEDLSG